MQTGLVTRCIGTAFENMLLKERYKWRENEEECVSSYWIALRKRRYAWILKKKHQMELCGEAMDLLYDRLFYDYGAQIIVGWRKKKGRKTQASFWDTQICTVTRNGSQYYWELRATKSRSVGNLPTPWSRVIFDKLIVPMLVKEFPAFYETWSFFTVSTRFRHLSLSWARLLQSTLPHTLR